MVTAWYITGGEDAHYQLFTKQLKAGVCSKPLYDRTVDLLIPIILEQEDKIYKDNIEKANEDASGTIIGIDVQHYRPKNCRTCSISNS